MTKDDDLFKLAVQVGHHLDNTGRQLDSAESCTGGWVGKVLTAIPGSRFLKWVQPPVRYYPYSIIPREYVSGFSPVYLEKTFRCVLYIDRNIPSKGDSHEYQV